MPKVTGVVSACNQIDFFSISRKRYSRPREAVKGFLSVRAEEIYKKNTVDQESFNYKIKLLEMEGRYARKLFENLQGIRKWS